MVTIPSPVLCPGGVPEKVSVNQKRVNKKRQSHTK
jgi:hypothetical protein